MSECIRPEMVRTEVDNEEKGTTGVDEFESLLVFGRN